MFGATLSALANKIENLRATIVLAISRGVWKCREKNKKVFFYHWIECWPILCIYTLKGHILKWQSLQVAINLFDIKVCRMWLWFCVWLGHILITCSMKESNFDWTCPSQQQVEQYQMIYYERFRFALYEKFNLAWEISLGVVYDNLSLIINVLKSICNAPGTITNRMAWQLFWVYWSLTK